MRMSRRREWSSHLDDLHSAIKERLGVLPTSLCLGQTQAQIVSIYDIRDGDTLRVIQPRLSGSDVQPLPAAPDASHDLMDGGPPAWRVLLKLFLTLAIFVMLERVFQHWVYFPYFRPMLEEIDNRDFVQGVRVPER